MHQVVYIHRFDVWVPQIYAKKKKKKLLDCISICNSPLKCNPFHF